MKIRIIVFMGSLFMLFISWGIGYLFISPAKFSGWAEYAILSTIWGIGILMILCLVCFIVFKLWKIVEMTIET